MEIDLELPPPCGQDKLEIKPDKDVNIVDATDEAKVEERVNTPITSEHVEEVHELRNQTVSSFQDEGCRSDNDVNRVMNVDERVSSGTAAAHVKEARGLDADQSVSNFQDEDIRSDKDVGIVDVRDEIDFGEHVSFPTAGEHDKEAHGLNANQSVYRVQDEDDAVNIRVSAVDKGNEVIQEPQNGLEFESKEEAYSYYREYARSVGFGIIIRASRRSKKSGKFIDIKMACFRVGSKRESGRTVTAAPSVAKTDCKANLHIKRREDGKWVVHGFVKEHNHEIFPEDFISPLNGRNKQLAIVACQKKGLQSALNEEDVRVMFEYFICMQDEDPNFFYGIDFDRQKRLRSVLWVDAKCKQDYSSFCDVVFFDTYYVRNGYKLPFVPIVGVNHHLQYILLGCALIGEETTSSFVWLMQTWLKAVGGQAPTLVITDQDKYLKEAVAGVFTDAYHCFCLWHVLTRIPENVDCFVNEREMFMAKFNKCIYRSWTVEQFEKKWWKLVDRFQLRENEWVHSLYADRKKWAPTFLQKSFLAGMSTKERSGSITAFFDRYMSQESTVKDLIVQYKAFSKDRYDMEANAAIVAQDKEPGLRSLSPFEKQMSTIYTDAIFKKFQIEILGLASCQLQKEGENEATIIFRVDDLEECQNFTVAWNEAELKVWCFCHSFPYMGFLCRHAVLVLQTSGVYQIPSHYILKRWTKDAKVRHTVSVESKRFTYRVQRFNDLCKLAVKLGDEGSFSPEAYRIACQTLESVLNRCVDVNNSGRSVLEANVPAVHGHNNDEEMNPNSSMAKSAKKKRTCRKRKGETEPDGIPIRSQDSCWKMEQMKARAHKVDNCHVPQQGLEKALESVLKPCVDVNNSGRSVLEANMPAVHGHNDAEEVNPNSSMAKSAKKNKTCQKRKGETEPNGIPIRSQDSCRKRKQTQARSHNVDKHKVDNCHAPQQGLEEEELASRSHGPDSCYGAQQSTQGRGQLNSTPIRDSYNGNQQATLGRLHPHYGTQQSMYAMGLLGFIAPTAPSCFEVQGNLQHKDQPVGSSRFHGNASKHPQDKHIS